MATADPIVLCAPAKVNLYLAVGDLRDDGYHDLTTVLHTVGLADVVRLDPAPDLTVHCDPPLEPSAADNTAARAVRALSVRIGREPRVAIRIAKHIPYAAGLGGGSSDAAAVIRGLCAWWGLDPDGEEALSAAREVGADVAFFLLGGATLYSGRGDVLVRRLPPAGFDLVLVNPGQTVFTADAYAALDRLGRTREARSSSAMERAVETGSPREIARALHNDMTEASIGLAPGIGEALGWLAARPGTLGTLMAGSGATVFAVCADAVDAARIAREARSRGWWAEATIARSWGVGPCGEAGEGGVA